jgi:hypothetical protein
VSRSLFSSRAISAEGPVARDAFGVFAKGEAASREAQLESLQDEVGLDAKDEGHSRTLAQASAFAGQYVF